MFGCFLGAVSRPPLAVVGTSKKGKVSGAKKRHSIKKESQVMKETKIEARHKMSSNAKASTGEKRNSAQLNKFKRNNRRKAKSGSRKSTNVEQPRSRKGGRTRATKHILTKLNKIHKNTNQTKNKTMIYKATKSQQLKQRRRIKFIQSYRDKHIEAKTIYHKQRLKDKRFQ